MLQRAETFALITPEQSPRDGRGHKELTYEEFQKLAAIAQIYDEDKKLRFYLWVQQVVKGHWKFDQYCDAMSPEFVRLERLLKRAQVAWRALTRAAANYTKLMDEVGSALLEGTNESNRILDRKGISFDPHLGATAPGSFQDFVERLTELERSRPSRRRSERNRGRPAGSEGDRTFRLLVVDVLTGVKEAGGHLSFNNEDENKGGLCQALRFLAPFLPPDTVPKRLPLRTIRRIVRSSAGGQ